VRVFGHAGPDSDSNAHGYGNTYPSAAGGIRLGLGYIKDSRIEDMEMKTKAILVIPADCPNDGVTPWPLNTNFKSSKPASVAAYVAAFSVWLRELDEWFTREVGKTLDWEVVVHRSQTTLDHLQRPWNGAEYGPSGADAYAQGLDLGSFWLHVIHLELGLAVWHEPGPWKWAAVVLGAGGWCGGGSDVGGPDTGYCILGDWGLNFDATGEPDPGCMAHYGKGVCERPKERAFGHEFLHACYVDSHNPPVDAGDALSDQQKADLLAHNSNWLIEPELPEPPEDPRVLHIKADAYDEIAATVDYTRQELEALG